MNHRTLGSINVDLYRLGHFPWINYTGLCQELIAKGVLGVESIKSACVRILFLCGIRHLIQFGWGFEVLLITTCKRNK